MSRSADPRLCRWLGLAGSMTLAAGGLTSGALPLRMAHWDAGVLVVYFGLILLIGSWWLLRRAQLTPAWTVGTLILWAVPLTLGPPLFSRDVYSYVAQGTMVLHNLDVYRLGPASLGGPLAAEVPAIWQQTPAPYGPVFLRAAAGVASLAQADVVVGVLGMRLLALVGLALMVAFLPRLATACGVRPEAALWLGALNPLVLLHFVAGAHNDALMLGLLIAGLALAARPLGAAPPAGLSYFAPIYFAPECASSGLAAAAKWAAIWRLPAAGVLVSLAALVKAPAAVGLVAVAALWAAAAGGGQSANAVTGAGQSANAVTGAGRGKATGAAAGRLARARGFGVAALKTAAVAAGTTAAVTLLAGTGLGWLSALDTPVSAGNWSVSSAIGRLHSAVLHAEAAIPWWRWIGLAATLVIGLVFWIRQRRRPVYALGVGLVTLALLGPATRPWYLLWGLIPLAAAAPEGQVRRWSAGIAALSATVVLPDGYPPTVRQLALAVLGGALALLALLAGARPRGSSISGARGESMEAMP
jgi:alpha-1,6-mannosyltransferase